ncbi:ATP-binding cassette transporter [Penicillium longicatenatum]|uniref:ATP-binding cassette transporter n=1 Tax=Penicillium longicatenatum TaxID=1561947 RepID=UPI002549BD11|nr:ATP-binding cassette transporter [Penicillium longicatenatum]KAJ5657350.1 ATP-binding cassette transporter [Penicillium longicatenatum]
MALAQQETKMLFSQSLSWGCWSSIILSSLILQQLMRRIRHIRTSSRSTLSLRTIRHIIFPVGFLIIQLTAVWRVWSVPRFHERLFICAAIISLLASAGILVGVFLEPRLQPTQTLAVYLALALVRDLVALTSGISDPYEDSDHLVKLRACWEGAWLVFHLLSHGQTSEECPTSEEAAGLFSKILFLWVLPVLKEGYKATLSLYKLPEIHSSLRSEALREKVLGAWTARGKGPRSVRL